MPIWFDHNPDEHLKMDKAIPIWFPAAVPILVKYSCELYRCATYGQFAEDVYAATTLRADVTMLTWPRKVLGMVQNYCEEYDLPQFASLVVNGEDGMCGKGFRDFYEARGEKFADEFEQEQFAAVKRVECYRRFAVNVPENLEKFHTPIHEEYLDKLQRRVEREAQQQLI